MPSTDFHKAIQATSARSATGIASVHALADTENRFHLLPSWLSTLEPRTPKTAINGIWELAHSAGGRGFSSAERDGFGSILWQHCKSRADVRPPTSPPSLNFEGLSYASRWELAHELGHAWHTCTIEENVVETPANNIEQLVASFSDQLLKSQKAFWRAFDFAGGNAARLAVQNVVRFGQNHQVPIIDGQHRVMAIRSISERRRLEIAEAFLTMETLRTADLQDWRLADLFEKTFEEMALAAIKFRVVFVFRPHFNLASTHEWVRSFQLWTGCSPPQDSTVRHSTQCVLPVHGGYNDYQNIRPEGHTSDAVWHHRRPEPRRCGTYRIDRRPAYRDCHLDRSAFYVWRRSNRARQVVQHRSRPELAHAL
jgi:hypothetical protein